ncbi:PH domain-containing protein [Microbacterium terrisoli]|uniref:PH domain-containing protein n=1 Tax=Microbacterium terrisoli TaxID=3242192 RepID=UPI0028049E79|nr:PH domain-containing protein [Microbacterium protaetiae]
MTEPRPAGPTPLPGARSPLSDAEWHRMHPLTPLFRGGLVLVIVIGVVISNLRERIIDFFLRTSVPEVPDFENPGDPVDFILRHNLVLWALLAVLVVVVVLVGLFYLAWRFHSFRITGDNVEVRHGVLFRSQRRAPLDRVQGVNLTRPMIARLLGMAKLEVVGAGSDSNVKLEYLSTSNAEEVRADILRLASGRRLAEARAKDAATPGGSRVAAAASVVTEALNDLVLGAEDPVAEPASVVQIPVVRLLLSRVFGRGMIIIVVLITAAVIASIVGTPWILFTIIPMVLGFGTVLVRSTTKALRYSIAPTPDGVRITYGLFTTVTETLPPGRIHAIEVSQPLLWRPAGWWAVRVNRMSGRRADANEQDQFSEVLPVGDRADVERVLRLLMPGMPENGWPLVFEHGILGPRSGADGGDGAGAGAGAGAGGGDGADGGDPYTNTPARARILRPLSWRRNGFLLAERALFLRRGYIWRNLAVFPLARLQSVGLHQGPLDRALNVAKVHAHTISGRVSGSLGAVDRDAATALFARAEAAAVAAGAADHTHRWAGEDS